MRISSTIKDRLEQNSKQRRVLRGEGSGISRPQEIRLEYLRIEARTFNDMLIQLRGKHWKILKNKKLLLLLAIVAMSIYVLGIFYMFKELDLAKVEQWQFAMAVMPFWLIMALVPMAIITFITARNTRS